MQETSYLFVKFIHIVSINMPFFLIQYIAYIFIFISGQYNITVLDLQNVFSIIICVCMSFSNVMQNYDRIYSKYCICHI